MYYERRVAALAAAMLALGVARAYAASVIHLPRPEALLSTLAALREAVIARTQALFGANSGVIGGMLWGNKAGLGADAGAFRDVGIAHVFAVSGLHVSFFVGALMLLIPKSRPRLRFYVTGAFLLVYCGLCAFPASLLRAGVMAMCMLGAQLIGRRGDMASSLGFAALIILTASPAQLGAAGFQMSFAAVACIAMLYDGLHRAFRWLGEDASMSVAVSLAATVGTLPLIAYYFGRIPIVSLPANLLLLPALPVAVVCGFLAVIADFISPVLSYLPALIASFITDVTVAVCRLIAQLPLCAVNVPPFGFIACVPYYMGLYSLSRYPLIRPATRLCIFLFMTLLCFISVVWI